jgi:hypothetical protein
VIIQELPVVDDNTKLANETLIVILYFHGAGIDEIIEVLN